MFSRFVFFFVAWSKGEWHELFSRYLFWFAGQSCKVHGVAKIKSAMVLGLSCLLLMVLLCIWCGCECLVLREVPVLK